MIITSSPGKVILFGEHAVVYDKLGIACTIDKRCYVKVSFSNKENISVRSIDLDLSNSFQEKQLLDLFETINKLKTNKEFQKIREIYQENRLVPVFFILGDIAKKYGFRGLEIEIKSDIPKNLGSSSAVFSAVAFGVLSLLKEDVSKKEISDFAFLGDILAHGGTPSGIDNTIVTYGGYLKYKKSQGVIPLNINFEIPLLIVDSGEEAQTGEMVSFVREEKKKNSKFVDDILHSLDIISQKALGALTS